MGHIACKLEARLLFHVKTTFQKDTSPLITYLRTLNSAVLLTGAAFPVRTLKVVWVPFTEAMALFGYGTSPLYWGSRLFRKRGYVSRLGNQLS